MQVVSNRRSVIGIAAAGLALCAVLAFGSRPDAAPASSHREAPMISEDPTADNTDVYAAHVDSDGDAEDDVTYANRTPNNLLGDGVDENDRPLKVSFPYVGEPHQGYEHVHHSSVGGP